MDFILNNITFLIWGSVAAALFYGFWLINDVLKQPAGDEKMAEIARAIQIGASAYLQRQYKVVGVVALLLAALIYYTLGLSLKLETTIRGRSKAPCFFWRAFLKPALTR